MNCALLFIDTANISDVMRYWKWGVFSGITTNQKLFSMEQDIDFKARIRELLMFRVPVSVELAGQGDVSELVKEGLGYAETFGREYLVVKVPMWKGGRGLEVASRLLALKVKVNMTCLMDVNQVILACEVGASFASLFYCRMSDYETRLDAAAIVEASRRFVDCGKFKTRIICGSIRHSEDVEACFLAGAHIVTVTPKVLEQMPFHLKTEETILEFDEAWLKWNQK